MFNNVPMFSKLLTHATLWTLALRRAAAIPLDVCSNENTAPGEPVFSTFNSYGFCTGRCKGYAFAVMQGKECWCTDFAPISYRPLAACNESCPGYPDDRCGSVTFGLYGYAQIGTPKSRPVDSQSLASSVTESLSTAIPLSSPEAISTSVGEVILGVASSISISALTTSASKVTSSSTSEPQSSTSSQRATLWSTPSRILAAWPSSFAKSMQMATTTTSSSSFFSSPSSFSGSVTRSSTDQPTASPVSRQKQGFWHNRGAVGGVFAAIGAVVVILVLAILWLCCRRHRAGSSYFWQKSDDDSIRSSYFGSNSLDAKIGPDAVFVAEYDVEHRRFCDQRIDPDRLVSTDIDSLKDYKDYSRKLQRISRLQVRNPD